MHKEILKIIPEGLRRAALIAGLAFLPAACDTSNTSPTPAIPISAPFPPPEKKQQNNLHPDILKYYPELQQTEAKLESISNIQTHIPGEQVNVFNFMPDSFNSAAAEEIFRFFNQEVGRERPLEIPNYQFEGQEYKLAILKIDTQSKVFIVPENLPYSGYEKSTPGELAVTYFDPATDTYINYLHIPRDASALATVVFANRACHSTIGTALFDPKTSEIIDDEITRMRIEEVVCESYTLAITQRLHGSDYEEYVEALNQLNKDRTKFNQPQLDFVLSKEVYEAINPKGPILKNP